MTHELSETYEGHVLPVLRKRFNLQSTLLLCAGLEGIALVC